MKKLILLGAFLIAPLFSYAACLDWCENWTLEARGGYLWFVDDDARTIYDQGGAEYEIEIGRQVCDCVSTWGNVNYFSASGHSIGLDDPTTLRITTLSAGLKIFYPILNRTNIYVGAGGLYAFYRGRDRIADEVAGDENAIIHERTHKNGLGFVGKLGLTYCICSNLYFDLFADYYYQRVRFHYDDQLVIGRKADYSNIRLGGGIGYAF